MKGITKNFLFFIRHFTFTTFLSILLLSKKQKNNEYSSIKI